MTADQEPPRDRMPDPIPVRDAGERLVIHAHIHTVGGEAGRALAAGQGRALWKLLAFLAEIE